MRAAIIVATFGGPEWERLATERAVPSALAEYEASDACVGVCHIHAPERALAEARNEAARSFMVPGEGGSVRIASLAHPEDAREFDVQDEGGADWLCFLDADDELEPGYLDAMEHALSLQRVIPSVVNPPLLVPLLRRVPAGGYHPSKPVWATYPNKGQWPRVNECVIGTLVHRRLFDAVGGFRDQTDDGTPIAMYEDWDLWLRCWNSGAQLVYTAAVYREYVNQAGRNTNAHLAQKTYDAIWADHERDSVVLGRGET